ncbi:sugar phosphate isomerase/epimerase family protein [Eudoraea sp.]|uniref:sugar phosphate isomerase/epimerase family protein n=2 Tax=Eudoraea sp. TaxID=1979955 RepID=UPI003C774F74
MERRTFIKNTSSAGLMGLVMPIIPSFSPLLSELRFGIAEASYMQRRYRNLESKQYPAFTNSLDMIDYSASIGFGGMQFSVRNWDKDYAKTVRKRVEELEVFLEGQISLPKNTSDISRFEAEVEAARTAGIDVLRTACLSGRRYETFKTMGEFQDFKIKAEASIKMAEPIIKKHKIKLAIENHKDWLIEEMIQLLNGFDRDWVGVTLDTGNNIALLEDPMEVVKALAPYSFSVHLKDMGVEEYEDGFLLSEINLGEGYLDIDEMVRLIKKSNPDIRFNLEMITRDPLKIPCLTESYWETFDGISANQLASFLHGLKKVNSKKPLPEISGDIVDHRLEMETKNNQTSLNYAKEQLGFT